MSTAGVETMAAAAAKSDWQSEWKENSCRRDQRGQVTAYGPPAISYPHAIGAFQSLRFRPNL